MNWKLAGAVVVAALALKWTGTLALEEMKRKIEDRRVVLDWNRRQYGKRK